MRNLWSPALGLGLALSGASSTLAYAQSAPEATVDQFPQALEQYRRVELLVPPGFSARCERAANTLICRFDGMAESFVRQLRALRGGAIDKVDIRGRRGALFEVRLELKAPTLAFRSAMLAAPARWVLEVGLPVTMSDPVEDETPFRPYPLPPAAYEPRLPKSAVVAPVGEGPAAKAVGACVAALTATRFDDALRSCGQAEKDTGDDKSLGVMASMARAEAAAALALQGRAPDLTTVTEALGRGEQLAPTPETRARFVLLQARSYEPMGFPARGEAHLESKDEQYRGTAAEPWLVAGQLAAEEAAGNRSRADALLLRLQAMPGDNPNIAGALLLAAGQAYGRRDWVRALELFDETRRRWPGRLDEGSAALFQAAEVCAYFGRHDDARALYQRYLEKFPRVAPHHIVRVRAADLGVGEDALAARARLVDLALALKEPEGQHLAALHAIRLTSDPKERRRTLRQVERARPTDYVLPELLHELSKAALSSGRVREAYDQARDLWQRFPNDALLRRAPLYFDRLLTLLMLNYVELDRPLMALSTYYAERRRFEAHSRRGAVHLLAGRALNRLSMNEEAFGVLQRGLQPGRSPLEPEVEAWAYLEMVRALYALEDSFRLPEILRFLDRKYPNRYDTADYWRARAAAAGWAGRWAEARDIVVYALNGPVTPDERVELAIEAARLNAALGDAQRTARALETLVELHDAAGRPRSSPERRGAVWRLAELSWQAADWPASVAGFGRFLQQYPGDRDEREALFFQARALIAMGDLEGGVRRLDGLKTDPKGGAFGRLAGLELEVMKWDRRQAPAVLREAGLPVGLVGRPTSPSKGHAPTP